MRKGTVSSVLGVASVVVAAVGLLDAVVGRVWDLAVVFGALVLLGAGLVATGLGSRRRVSLRADLAARVSDRARRTGEDPDAVLDRGVATYLEALADEPAVSGADPGRGGGA